MKALPLSLLALAIVTFAHSAGKELTGTYLPADTTCPPPEEARAKMTVPEGYRVECFAHEPMVQNPVAMTWDTRGRLWVVEAYEYPNGTELPVEKRPFGQEAKDDQYHPVPPQCIPSALVPRPSSLPRDRVIILEDTDNDGVADKRTVFVEGLNLASAILCGDDGIYVGQQPHLIHFRDADHDDKPEAWRVILTGFGREDTHELVNSFCWGPDGWLYMTHGVFTHSAVRRPGVPEKEGFKFDAGIGRCRPVERVSNPLNSATGLKPVLPWEFEVFADGTSNPWGCDYDARGNFFVSACVIDHFFHMAPGGIYVRQGGAPENPYAYEQLPSIVTHKHFRAAYAGVQIYQGGVYPQDTWGHAFIGNIHDNAIHEEVLTPVGSTFKCEPRRDFLRANNGWFRPVSTQTGPDGNLWVMDWCDKYPCYQNAKANPEGVDRERGRIWRITHDVAGEVGVQASAAHPASDPSLRKSPDAPSNGSATASARPESAKAYTPTRPTKDMDLAKLSTPELVKLLEHPNNWMRRKARRVLSERRDLMARFEMDNMVTVGTSEVGQTEALWALWGCRVLGDYLLDAASWHKNPGVRHWAARLTHEKVTRDSSSLNSFEENEETQLKAEIEKRSKDPKAERPDSKSPDARLGRLAADPDPFVRLGAAISLRQYNAGALTKDRFTDPNVPRGDCFPGSIPEALVRASVNQDDSLLRFMIWQAFEPHIGEATAERVSKVAEFAMLSPALGSSLSHKSMRRLCDTRDSKNLDLCLDFLTKIKAHDVLLAHALDGLVKGQEGGVIKPTKDFSSLFAEFAKSDNADVRKHAKNLAMLWGDPAAIKGVAAELLDAKLPEAQRLAALASLRKVRSEAARAAYAELLTTTDWKSAPEAFAIEAMRAGSDLGDDDLVRVLSGTGILPVASPAGVPPAASGRIPDAPVTGRMPVLLAAYATLTSRADWTHQLLGHLAAAKATTNFPVSLRRQLNNADDIAIRKHANEVFGLWRESSEDLKALIAAKKKACLEGEPDLAQGKLLFTTTCAVCHTFYGGGQKVGPELIGSGRSNLDAILANVIDPNQIIGNGYENVVVSTKDNRTLMGRITEDTPSHVKLLAIGGAESTVPRDQIAKLENTHQSLMPMGFGGLPDDQFRNLIWYVLAPPDEGPLTADKKKALSTSIDAPAKPKSKWAVIDWESVSLWNPKWKVIAPEFERTPLKLADYHGRKNVLLMHPFEDKKTPCVLEQKLVIDAAHPKLKFGVAADDRGDWMVRVVVNGQAVKELAVDHEQPRWRDVEIDLSAQAGKEVSVRLEGHATGWSWEFSYWDQVRWE